jgi:Glycosyl transferases group 1
VSGKRSSLRVAFVCHRHHLGGHQGHVYHALARRFILTQVVVEEDGWPQRLSDFPEGGEFDAILWRVRFRELRHRPPFDWQAYPGPRIMLDHDTCRNYPDLWPKSWNSDFHGAWPPVIRHQGFDLVLASGKRVCELLRDDGVPAVWMPKAYAANWLFDTGADRQGIGYYGALYPARRAMLSHLDRSSVAVRRFQCPASDLNDHLNRCLGVIICNMGGPLEGRIGDEPNQPYPNGFTFAPEAMLKNFEVAAAGTVPFCDPTPDLADLGFLDGRTAVVYSTFDDLVDRLHASLDQPEQLREIGRRAADLVRARHTWDHRVAFLEKLLHSPNPATAELSWDLVTSRIQGEDS